MSESQFYLGTPSSATEPYYVCQWCMVGFTGPESDEPVCPSCDRARNKKEKGGVFRANQQWVARRFEEKEVVTKVHQNYPHASPEAIGRLVGQETRSFRKERFPVPKTDAPDKPKAAKKIRQKHPCLCGCNIETGGKWAPGHDARVYSAVSKAANGNMSEVDLKKAFPPAAIEECRSKLDTHK